MKKERGAAGKKRRIERGPSLPPVLQTPPAFTSSAKAQLQGLHLVEDFISAEEERNILHLLDADQCASWEVLRTSSNRRGVRPRRVQHFGHSFDYDSRQFSNLTQSKSTQTTHF